MKKSLLLFIITFLTITFTQAQWIDQSLPSYSTQWNSVHFTDDNTGYAVGVTGEIIKTTDGGVR